MERPETVLRVVRGQADGEELAALAAVLLALRACGHAEPEHPSALGWNWWKQSKDYAAPGGWR